MKSCLSEKVFSTKNESPALRAKRGYVLQDYPFDSVAPCARVLDVGSGFGEQLERVIRRGSYGIGMDISSKHLVSCQKKGLIVVQAMAELLPFKDNSFDGVICKVVLSYTDEKKVIYEISRVLRSGGHVELCVHGLGYYIHMLIADQNFLTRIYALLSLINTWIFVTTGKRWRDTIYQTHRRMKRYCKSGKLEIERITPSKTFVGMPVFVYYRLKKM